MFLCQAARSLGISTSVMSETKEFSAKDFCNNFIGKFDNLQGSNNFIDSADIFTIETENTFLLKF